jgi:hypothetical protein
VALWGWERCESGSVFVFVSVSGADCGWCWQESLMRMSWVCSDKEAVAVVDLL